MYSPRRFGPRVGNIGTPLVNPIDRFGREKVHFRSGATSMIAGKPGSFKSVLALNIAASWAKAGVGSLYFCADSDEFTVVKRLSGILTGHNLDDIETRLIKGQTRHYEQELASLEGLEFEYEKFDFDTVVTRVKAYEQVYGQYPPVIFLDNLIDFVDYPDDFGGMLVMIRDLDKLAKETKSHVCVLHHAKIQPTNTYQDGTPKPTYPPADWEIQGKVTQLSRLVLTVAAEALQMKVACVKNTNGPQHPNGRDHYMTFNISPSMRLNEVDNYGQAHAA